jgi:CRISPR-associated protein Cas2
MADKKRYIICYDIREHKRLAKVHRICSHYAMAIQYSLFYAELPDSDHKSLISDLAVTINEREDDVRIYLVSGLTNAEALGNGCAPRLTLAGLGVTFHDH